MSIIFSDGFHATPLPPNDWKGHSAPDAPTPPRSWEFRCLTCDALLGAGESIPRTITSIPTGFGMHFIPSDDDHTVTVDASAHVGHDLGIVTS